jgi:hypothetical protein
MTNVETPPNPPLQRTGQVTPRAIADCRDARAAPALLATMVRSIALQGRPPPLTGRSPEGQGTWCAHAGEERFPHSW